MRAGIRAPRLRRPPRTSGIRSSKSICAVRSQACSAVSARGWRREHSECWLSQRTSGAAESGGLFSQRRSACAHTDAGRRPGWRSHTGQLFRLVLAEAEIALREKQHRARSSERRVSRWRWGGTRVRKTRRTRRFICYRTKRRRSLAPSSVRMPETVCQFSRSSSYAVEVSAWKEAYRSSKRPDDGQRETFIVIGFVHHEKPEQQESQSHQGNSKSQQAP